MNESICRSCFHSYVCEQFNEHRDSYNEKCHFFNDHFVSATEMVERKRGEWVVTKAYNDVIEMDVVKYTCSACGEYRLSATGLSQATNFCPNCGADMREK